MFFTPVFIFLTLVSSTEEGHICRPPPGEEEFLAILFFAIMMMTLLTTSGFQLKEAARLDREKQRRRERGKGGLAEEDRDRGEEKRKICRGSHKGGFWRTVLGREVCPRKKERRCRPSILSL